MWIECQCFEYLVYNSCLTSNILRVVQFVQNQNLQCNGQFEEVLTHLQQDRSLNQFDSNPKSSDMEFRNILVDNTHARKRKRFWHLVKKKVPSGEERGEYRIEGFIGLAPK